MAARASAKGGSIGDTESWTTCTGDANSAPASHAFSWVSMEGGHGFDLPWMHRPAALQEDQEFIPAITCNEIAVSDMPQKDGTQVAQDLVTALMAEVIVDWLEAVEVQAKQGKRLGIGIRTTFFDVLRNTAQISQPGQRVRERMATGAVKQEAIVQGHRRSFRNRFEKLLVVAAESVGIGVIQVDRPQNLALMRNRDDQCRLQCDPLG